MRADGAALIVAGGAVVGEDGRTYCAVNAEAAPRKHRPGMIRGRRSYRMLWALHANLINIWTRIFTTHRGRQHILITSASSIAIDPIIALYSRCFRYKCQEKAPNDMENGVRRGMKRGTWRA